MSCMLSVARNGTTERTCQSDGIYVVGVDHKYPVSSWNFKFKKNVVT